MTEYKQGLRQPCQIIKELPSYSHPVVPFPRFTSHSLLTLARIFAKWPGQIVHNTKFSLLGSFMVKEYSITVTSNHSGNGLS